MSEESNNELIKDLDRRVRELERWRAKWESSDNAVKKFLGMR